MATLNDTLEEEENICHKGNEVQNWVTISVGIIAAIISIFGFLGNLLTILALPHIRKLRHSATWFVVNLAATELVFCAIILPMQAIHLVHLGVAGYKVYDDDNRACQMFVYVRFVLIHAEIFSIAAIAINRCVLIAMPKKYPLIFTTKKTIIFITIIWVYSGFVMIFPLIEVFGIFSYNECTDECDFGRGDDSESARKVYLANGFLIPCIIIVASYSYIFHKSRQSTKRMLILQAGASSKDATGPAEGLRNRDLRIIRTIGVIFVVFLFCCFPVSVAHYYGSEGQIPTTLLLLHPLYWLQYCLNSLIYVLMNRQYREAYITYISIWWPRFRTIVEKWYQEATDDDTSTNVQGSSKKNSSTRKHSRDNPQSSPKTGGMIKMSLLNLKIPTPQLMRNRSKTPPVGGGDLQNPTESQPIMEKYKPINPSLKVVQPDNINGHSK